MPSVSLPLSLFTLAMPRNLTIKSPGTATVLNPSVVVAGFKALLGTDGDGDDGSVAAVITDDGLGAGTGLVFLSNWGVDEPPPEPPGKLYRLFRSEVTSW